MNLPITRLVLLALLLPALSVTADERAQSGTYTELQALARSYFEWRRVQQPVGGDDIPRVERPAGWVPDWSPGALEDYRAAYHRYLEAADAFDTAGWSVPQQVDQRLQSRCRPQ